MKCDNEVIKLQSNNSETKNHNPLSGAGGLKYTVNVNLPADSEELEGGS